MSSPYLFAPSIKSGGIEDLGLGLRWNASTLRAMKFFAARRVLSQMGIGRGPSSPSDTAVRRGFLPTCSRSGVSGPRRPVSIHRLRPGASDRR